MVIIEDKMKYLFLAGSIIFGVAGLSQAMDAIKSEGISQFAASPLVYNFQTITLSFTPLPGFARILILSIGFFALYVIWQKLKSLGMGKIADYIL